MIKVLVISDTHIPVTATKLPSIIEEEAKGSDCCLYCGDCITVTPLEVLEALTKVYAVCGNMDDEIIRKRLPIKRLIRLADVTVALTHGGGRPANVLDYVKNEFVQEFNSVDIFVFGHSHMPLDTEIDGKIYFNPGSPTDQMFAPYRSYGVLEIEGKNIKRRIVKIG